MLKAGFQKYKPEHQKSSSSIYFHNLTLAQLFQNPLLHNKSWQDIKTAPLLFSASVTLLI